ncbi:MAG: hypothetical protein A4S17_00305 [Proteobacteria bacterium HN_bin10]|nr:MAG: hypothetical protein A4S17_00305 [Proteobacteria bacterium HN_bin10]
MLAALSDLSERLVGGDVYVKRALAATLAHSGGDADTPGGNQAGVLPVAGGGFLNTVLALRGGQAPADPTVGDFEIETLFGNIATAQDYAQYLQNAAVINALIAAEPASAFTAGWTITFARVMELGLDRRWKSDWLGGWAAFLDETADGKIDGGAFAPANVFLELDPETNERLFVFVDSDGSLLGVLGDTIDTASKTLIEGGAGNDTITLANESWSETRTVTETVTVGANRTFFNRRTNSNFTIDAETHYLGTPITLDEGVVLTGETTVTVTREVTINRIGWRVANAAGLTIDGEAVASGPSDQVRVAALIDGGAGDDTIRGGDLGNDLLGGDGNDTLIGGALDDWQFGGDGNDRLFAGNVTDTNFSDTATDAASEAARDAAVTVDGGNGDYLDGGAGDDSIYGGRGSDWLNGGAGVDSLRAGDGGDVLDGGEGDDRGANGEAFLLGGAGSDQYVFYFGAGNDVIFDASDPAAIAGANLYTINTRYASLGTNPGNRNWAGNGAYEVDGSVVGGEDAISFGAGIGFEDISLRRGLTNGVANSDLIIELTALNESNVRVPTGDTLTIRDWFDDTRKVEWLRFADGQDIRIGDISSIIIGPNVGDSIIGTNGADWAIGTTDDDDFSLLNGDDFGFGGRGDDLVHGDGDNDFLSGGDDNDIVIGDSGHDTVFGDAGADLVEGNGGNDIVAGGRGDDRVVGGTGNDLYRFSRGDGRDVVLDDYAANTTTEEVFDPTDYVNDYERTQDWRALQAAMDGVIDTNYWNLPLMWDGATGTLRQRTAGGSVTVSNAGLDTFEFGYGIDVEDIQLARIGDDLVLAIANGSFDASAFMAIADRITFEDWIAVPGQIERFSFVETGLLDISSWTLGGAATDGADTLNGSTGIDWLTGGLGDDVISALAGDDILTGNHGADRLNGGAGIDVIYGGADNDVIDGGAGADRIFGGAGHDVASYASQTGSGAAGIIVSLAHSYLNNLDAVGDQLISIEGLEGTSRNDQLSGDAGENTLRGLGGNDTLKGDLGEDTYEVNAGEGDDVIIDRGAGIEEIIDANGQLRPGFEADWEMIDITDMWGGYWYTYQMTVTRGPGGEIVYQSNHNDFVYTSPQHQNPPPPSAWPFANGQWVSGAVRTGVGAQTVIETANNANAGYDTLELGAGLTLSNLSAERINNGQDLKITFLNGAAANGSATIRDQYYQTTGETPTRVRAVEELILNDGLAANLSNLRLGAEAGTADDDLYLGDGASNSFDGGAGDDVISGGAGDDTLIGGTGNDTFEGGAGADNFDGGADSVTDDHAARAGNALAAYGDAIRYVGSASGVAINLGTGAASGGDAAGDTFTGIENVIGSNAGNDTLTGGAGHNQIAGLGGDDQISGLAGDDVIAGGAGNDVIDGGDGHDNILGDEGNDVIHAGAGDDLAVGGDGNDQIWGGAGNEQFDGGAGLSGGAGDDVIHGDDGADIISGDEGADTLYGDAGEDKVHAGDGDDHVFGGDGDDVIAGGAGADVLEGGAGNDTYVFDAASGVDRIVDASGDRNAIVLTGVTHDKIWLSQVGNDLKIGVIGGDATITVADYFAAGGSRVRSIATDTHTLYLAHAGDFITAMTASSATTPASVAPAIAAMVGTYWSQGIEAAPRAVTQSAALNEDGSISGVINTIDPDEQALSYAVVEGPAHGLLTFTASTGAWTYTPTANWSGTDGFDVRVTDADGASVIQHVTINVAAVNDAPTIGAPALTVVENATNGAAVGTLTGADVDGPASEISYQLTDSAGGRFALSADGQVTVANGGLLNFETGASYQISVTASDAGGAVSAAQTFTISLTDVNEAPTALGFANQAASISEAASTVTRTKIADLNVVDDALGAETITLSGADAALFEVVDGALYLRAGVALNYEAKTSFAVTVNVDDPSVGGAVDATQSLTFSVTDANEAPTALSFSNVTASLSDTTSTASRILVADLNITDDALGLETIGITGADAAFFEIFNGALYLKAGTVLNATTKPNYSILVTVDDPTLGSGVELTQAFNLSVGAGLSLSFANTVSSLAESTSTATRVKVADLVVADDVGTPILSLTGADAASFEIVGNALYLKAGVSLNYEAKTAYNVSVVMDEPDVGSGPDLTRNFTLSVSDVNEAPTALSLTNTVTSLAENTSTATRIKVADIGYSDDALGAETITLSGADAGSFEVIAGVLYLKAGVALNYEAKASYSVNVNVDDATVGGNPDLSQTFTLNVTDVNEAPSALSFANTVTSLAENTSTASRVKVADLSIADDALGSETITLSGADAASFEIFNGALYIKAGVALNFETKASYAVIVNVDDPTVGANPDVAQTFTLTLTNVNEAPTAVSFANTTTTMSELTGASPVTTAAVKVADIVITDDALGAETLTLSGADAASFEIVGSELRLRAGVTLNREVKSSFTLTVNADDATVGANPDASQTFALTLNDVNEAPSLNWTGVAANGAGVTWNATTRTLGVPENTATGGVIATLATIDPDAAGANNTLFYQLSGTDANRFTINAATGQISLAQGLNFEASPNAFTVTVTVWDGGAANTGLSSSNTFTFAALNVNEAPIGSGPAAYFASNRSAGTVIGTASATDPEGNSFTYAIHGVSRQLSYAGELTTTTPANSTYTISAGGVVTLAASTNIPNTGVGTDTITIRVTDSLGAVGYFNASATYDRSGGGGGGGYTPPIVLDLNGDGVTLVPFAQSPILMDVNGDGVTEPIGWIGADDGFLALDRNGDGQIAGIEEISFAGDTEGAATDLEGLRIYDTNANGFFDTGDARFAEFRVWQDANSDGVAQTGEVMSLAERGVVAIGLTLSLTGQSTNNSNDNILFGTTNYVRSDGTTGVAGDVFLYYVPSVITPGGLPPIVFDLDGGGISLISRPSSRVMFDADNDGAVQRTGWFGPGEGVLALDRNGDGLIGSGAEISFVQDVAGAQTDLEGLRAYDSNGNGFFDLNDARFGEFRIWQDANSDGVSQASELKVLSEWNIVALNLTPNLTGASLQGADDNIVYATTTFVRGDGARGEAGDIVLSYDDESVVPPPLAETPIVPGEAETDWCGAPGKRPKAPAAAPEPERPHRPRLRHPVLGLDGWPSGWRNWRSRNGEPLDVMMGDWFGVDWESTEASGDRCATPSKTDVIRGQGNITPPILGLFTTATETPTDRRADNAGPRWRRRAAAQAGGADASPFDWIDRNAVAFDEDWAPQFAASRSRARLPESEATESIAQAMLAGADSELGLSGITQTAGASGGGASALHRGLALADKRVLHMINAMASFDAQGASDLARSSRQRDPRVAAMLTALPDIR